MAWSAKRTKIVSFMGPVVHLSCFSTWNDGHGTRFGKLNMGKCCGFALVVTETRLMPRMAAAVVISMPRTLRAQHAYSDMSVSRFGERGAVILAI